MRGLFLMGLTVALPCLLWCPAGFVSGKPRVPVLRFPCPCVCATPKESYLPDRGPLGQGVPSFLLRSSSSVGLLFTTWNSATRVAPKVTVFGPGLQLWRCLSLKGCSLRANLGQSCRRGLGFCWPWPGCSLQDPWGCRGACASGTCGTSAGLGFEGLLPWGHSLKTKR